MMRQCPTAGHVSVEWAALCCKSGCTSNAGARLMHCTPCGCSLPAGAAEAGADGPRMLAEALAAEASSAAKRSKDPFADLGVKFVEVRGRPPPGLPTWARAAWGCNCLGMTR